MRTARAITALALAGGVLSTTACDLTELGGYRTVAAQDPAPPPAATSPAPIPDVVPIADAPRPVVVLRARATGKFGTLVADARGRTLYRSDKDSAKPSRSRCAGACLKTWRPAMVTGTDFTVIGVDRALVGTIRRAGGGRQLTIAGWPVYTFVKDRPGQVLGQCKAGFFAITPEGAKTTMRG
jgi:predicted lipoprotein with Yx(FWY)xxD motif